MGRRVFIVHGWGGSPQSAWFPWLTRELEARGFLVAAPTMPETDAPKIELWVPHLAQTIGEPDKETFLVAHSMGCQTILRYLEGLPEGKRIGGAVLVAGFVRLTGLTQEEEPVAKPWLDTPIDLGKAKRSANTFIAIHSDNDSYVPLSNADVFREKLGAEVIVERGKGHFSGNEGIIELPSALDAVLRMAR